MADMREYDLLIVTDQPIVAKEATHGGVLAVLMGRNLGDIRARTGLILAYPKSRDEMRWLDDEFKPRTEGFLYG